MNKRNKDMISVGMVLHSEPLNILVEFTKNEENTNWNITDLEIKETPNGYQKCKKDLK